MVQIPAWLRVSSAALALTAGVAVSAVSAQETVPAPATESPAASPAAPDDEAPSSPEPEAAQAQPEDAATRNARILSAIAGLDPIIGDVQLLGPWTDGDRHGVWRTIMTQPTSEDGGNRFFVQQVEQTAGSNRVSSSVEVTEIAEVKGAVVGYRADAPAEGQESELTVFFDIVPLDGEISETYELFIAPNTPYRFGPASN